MIERAFLATLLLTCLLPAQQSDADAPQAVTSSEPGGSARSGPQSPQWKGLSVKEKLRYDWRHLFDPENMV